MAEPGDMIMPMLREMRAENASLHEQTRALIAALDRRMGSVKAAQASFKQALGADSLMSRLLTGEFDERIVPLEQRVRALEGHS